MFLHTGLHKSHLGDPQLPSCLSLRGQMTLEISVLSGPRQRAPNPPKPLKRRKPSRFSVLFSLGFSRWVRTGPVVNRPLQQPAVSCPPFQIHFTIFFNQIPRFKFSSTMPSRERLQSTSPQALSRHHRPRGGEPDPGRESAPGPRAEREGGRGAKATGGAEEVSWPLISLRPPKVHARPRM